MKTLKQILDKHGADRSKKHRYDKVYEKLWEPRRNNEIDFLEVGIWKGHGLAALQEYFPNGWIYGIDIFKRMSPSDVPALRLNRVQYLDADSTRLSTRTKIQKEFEMEFDFILDDGAHYPEANMLTFRTLSPLLKEGGVYIIEDVWPLEKMTEDEWRHPWIQKYPDRYNVMKNAEFLSEIEKSGLKIDRYDLRKQSGQPDSYLIVLTKE